MGKSKLKLGSIVVILTFTAVVGAYYFWNKPHRNPANEDAFQTSPAALFESMYLQGDKKLLNQTVQLTGTIASLHPGQETVCVIEVPNSPDASIRVSFHKEQTGPLAEYKAGDQISVKGICTGVLADTLMEEMVSVDILIKDASTLEKVN
ncbi:MAG: hypothetical protein IT240_09790 [Bacteroidia bacterium]|jgi:hypothetical protein|nr:hypothetical protein [Bacteroidia bacterium]MCC6769323.1 hypothetical protein [Bacteroidia bacterium]